MSWWTDWGRDLLNIGGQIYNSRQQGNAAQNAANAQIAGLDRAIDAQMAQYGINQQMADPYRATGTGALNMMAATYGLPSMQFRPFEQLAANYGGAIPGGSAGGAANPAAAGGRTLPGGAYSGGLGYTLSDLGTNWMSSGGPAAEPGSSPLGGNFQQAGYNPGGAPSMAGFFASPDYNFRRDEGLRGIEQSAAARGGALSGNALRGITDFSSNLAAGEYGNWWNRLAGMAGIGQTATGAQMQSGQNMANSVGNLYVGQGDARASGILGGANARSDLLNNLLNYGQARWG